MTAMLAFKWTQSSLLNKYFCEYKDNKFEETDKLTSALENSFENLDEVK